jgi:hypothetical protein
MKTLHPKSRKLAQLKRHGIRERSLSKRAFSYACSKINPLVERWTWFQTWLLQEGADLVHLEKPEIDALVHSYLSRWDEDISQLESERRKNRPRSAQEERLRVLRQMELEQASPNGGGLEIPDMTDAESVSALR